MPIWSPGGVWNPQTSSGGSLWGQLLSQFASKAAGGVLNSKPITGITGLGNSPATFAQKYGGAAASAAGSAASKSGSSSGSFWNQPGVGAALVGGGLNAVGGLLGGIGDSKQADANNAASKEELEARLAFEREQLAYTRERDQAQLGYDRERDMADRAQKIAELENQLQLDRDKTGLESTQMDPLYQQKSRQGNALAANIIGNARNIAAPQGIEGFRSTGGLKIPEGGFGQDVMSFFSPEARASAEGEFYKSAAPFTDPTDLTQVGYGGAGTAPTASAQAARQSWYDSELARKKAQQTALTGALNPEASTIPTTAALTPFKGASKTARDLFDKLGYQRRV